MKILTAIAALIGVIVCGNTYGEEINLICTGEEWYPSIGVKSPYSFQAMFDSDSKKFRIQLEKNAENKRDQYPKDNPWNKVNCPMPMWKLEITDTEFRVITACNESAYSEIGSQIWEVRRTDGSFSRYYFDTEQGKGHCVKSSERLF